jgi:hypothetical protein
MKKLFAILLVFVLSSPIFSSIAKSEDYLLSVDMNPGTTWDSSNLVPKEAQLHQIRYRIPRSNPDELIAQIVFKEKLPEDTVIVDDDWNLGFWIYAPSIWCYGDQKSCDYILSINPSYNGKSYIQKNGSHIDWDTAKVVDCPAPWRLDSKSGDKSVLSFHLSITCLGISKSFVSYAWSSKDIGVSPRPYHYTSPNYVDNGYFDLAKQSYEKRGGKNGLSQLFSSSEVNKLRDSLSNSRGSYYEIMERFDSFAPEIQQKIKAQKIWKEILKSEDTMNKIEESLDIQDYDDSQVIKWIRDLTKIINLQIAWLSIEIKLVPKFQCENVSKQLKTIIKNGRCPKGFTKIKTQQPSAI